MIFAENRVIIVTTYRDREAKPIAEVTETIRAITRDGTFLPLRRLDIAEVQLSRRARGGSGRLGTGAYAAQGNRRQSLVRRSGLPDAEGPGELAVPTAALPIPEGMREMIKKRLAA